MNQQTAAELLSAGGRMLTDQEVHVVNLDGVSAVDSSAIAVLLGWLRIARKAGNSFKLVKAPEAFLSLAELYGVSPIIFPESGSENSVEH